MEDSQKQNIIPVDQLKDGPGVTHLDLKDPSYPMYKMLQALRSPLTLREMMIAPVRNGYIGKDREIDSSLIPPSGAELFPEVIVSECLVPSKDGPIRCAVYHPPSLKPNSPMLLYAHGGGFMVGSSDDTDFITRKIAMLNQVLVISVNYRLAPEFPFPTGLNDVFTVYCWLQDYGSELGGNPHCLAVGGDSSGSNFAASIALMAKDENREIPKAVVLLGPLVDFHFEKYSSFNRLAPLGVVYDTAFVGFLRGAYTPQPKLWDHPYVSPILGDLSNYPPVMLIVGTEDPIVDSARAFAKRHEECSQSECYLDIKEGMIHGFYFFPNVLAQEHQAFLEMQQFLSRHLFN